MRRVRAVSRFCELYPDICLTTEEKTRKNLSQGRKPQTDTFPKKKKDVLKGL